jgi:hypothetical protein
LALRDERVDDQQAKQQKEARNDAKALVEELHGKLWGRIRPSARL